MGLPIDKRDEMLCVVQGCNFVLKNISDEAFVYNRKKEPAEYKFQTINPKEMYPYLLVTIGSGMISLNVLLPKQNVAVFMIAKTKCYDLRHQVL